MANRDDDGDPPRKPTPEEVNARFARLCVGAQPSKEHDPELARRIATPRRRPKPGPIDDAHLTEIVRATVPPSARDAVAERKTSAAVPATSPKRRCRWSAAALSAASR